MRRGKSKNEALNAVSFTALQELLSITFSNWEIYEEPIGEDKAIPEDECLARSSSQVLGSQSSCEGLEETKFLEKFSQKTSRDDVRDPSSLPDKKSSSPLLKIIEKNIFSVNFKQFSGIKDFGHLCSVYIEDQQVFGSGATQEEAKEATILAAFEYIETLQKELDEIFIAKHPKGAEPKKPKWMIRLKGEYGFKRSM